MLERGGSVRTDGEDGPCSTLGFSHARQLDAVCDAFELAWKQDGNSQPSLREYVERLPTELHEPAVVELLPIEIAYLRRRGAAIPLEYYRQRFPFVREHLDRWSSERLPALAPSRLAAGQHLDKYTIVGRLGAGGMGEVYRAVDSTLGRDVAIKVLHSRHAWNAEALARIKIEAQALAALNDPHILTVHELAQHDGLAYMVLEYLEGETLAARLQRSPLTPSEVLDLAGQIAAALAVAHEKKIVHRDLKPQNIFLTKGGQVKILDFGLARLLEKPAADAPQNAASPSIHGETMAGARLGTTGYMSPEQVRGETVDARSDVFSFGCVLFEMASGTPAFARLTVDDSDEAIQHEPAPQPDSLRRGPLVDLRPILSRCLQKARDRRYASATELSRELASVSAIQQQRQGRTLRRIERSVIVALGVLLLVIGGWLVVRAVLLKSEQEIVDKMKLALASKSPDVQQLMIWERNLNDLALYVGYSPDALAVMQDANEAIVRGFLLWERGKKEDIDAAILLFERAVQADPESAIAHVGLGVCYYRLSSAYVNPVDAMESVGIHARKAIELDTSAGKTATSTAIAYALLGLIEHRYNWDWKKADSHFKKAIATKNDSAIAHRFYGYSLALQGIVPSGIEELKAALQCDPESKDIKVDLALACLYAGQDGEAEKYLQEVLRDDPGNFPAQWAMGDVYLRRKEYGDAIKHLRKALRLDPDSPEVQAELAFCLGKTASSDTREDNLREAKAIVADLAKRAGARGGPSGERYVSYTALAVAQLGEADAGSALASLRKGLEEKDEWLVWLQIDPVFDDLRETAEFKATVEEIGLWPKP